MRAIESAVLETHPALAAQQVESSEKANTLKQEAATASNP
jgi:hypothetical protein